MSAARSLVERLDDRHLDVGVDLLERFGRDLLVDRLEHRFALGRRQVLDDVGDVGRVQLGEAFVGDLQLDAARRIGLEQIDELPRDDARRNPLEQRPQRERRDDALRRAGGWRRARRRRRRRRSASTWLLTGVDSISTSLTRTTLRPWTSMICWSRRSRLSSSTPSDGVNALPGGGVARRADGRAARRQRVGRQHALAVGRLDDQKRDAGRMILRRDGDFAHPSAHGAGGVAHGGAEQFRQGDDGHGWRRESGPNRQCHAPRPRVSSDRRSGAVREALAQVGALARQPLPLRDIVYVRATLFVVVVKWRRSG